MYNIGVIFLSKNVTTIGCTKNVNVRTKFVRQHQEEGKIMIKFVRSQDNTSDITTKNVNYDIYEKYSGKLVIRKL